MGVGLLDELCVCGCGARAMREEDVVIEDAVVVVQFYQRVGRRGGVVHVVGGDKFDAEGFNFVECVDDDFFW